MQSRMRRTHHQRTLNMPLDTQEYIPGMSVRHQTATGFSVSASKTIATTVSALYAATASAAKRKEWLPKGELEVSSQTKNKYFRGTWNGGARLEVGFYAKE